MSDMSLGLTVELGADDTFHHDARVCDRAAKRSAAEANVRAALFPKVNHADCSRFGSTGCLDRLRHGTRVHGLPPRPSGTHISHSRSMVSRPSRATSMRASAATPAVFASATR